MLSKNRRSLWIACKVFFCMFIALIKILFLCKNLNSDWKFCYRTVSGVSKMYRDWPLVFDPSVPKSPDTGTPSPNSFGVESVKKKGLGVAWVGWVKCCLVSTKTMLWVIVCTSTGSIPNELGLGVLTSCVWWCGNTRRGQSLYIFGPVLGLGIRLWLCKSRPLRPLRTRYNKELPL